MEEDKIILISISKDDFGKIILDKVIEAMQMQIEKQKEIMSFRECQEFLGVSSSTLNKWKAEGKIPFHRKGKRIFFKRQEIMDSLLPSSNSKLKELE